MFLNLDIWLEIIARFRYPRDKETLRSLALTSRCLSNFALDIIWRNQDASDLTIISVINSFAPSPKRPFVEYIRESGNNSGNSGGGDLSTSSSNEGRRAGIWVLNEPLPHTARTRALEYLARIRELVVWLDGPPNAEVPIWPILSAILSPHGPLLPNLRRLEIDFLVHDRNEYLIPLLSPSLKILVLYGERLPKLKAIVTFLNLAKASGCDLEEFTHESEGYSIEYLPEAITRFKNLQSVALPLNDNILQEAPITVVKFLALLPFLRSFTCNLATFSHSTDEGRLRHTNLKSIVLKSTQGALHGLFCQCIFPSVTEVKIWGDGQVLNLEGLETSCPNTWKLDVSVSFRPGQDDMRPLEFKHLTSLSFLPIQMFRLEVPHLKLTPSHLRTFMQSWPNLRNFEIFSLTLLDPLSSLAIFSNHPCLERFDVGLPLYPLLHDISKVKDLMETHVITQGNSVHTLYFDCSHDQDQTLTVATTEKRVLVKYLHLLFPRLEELRLTWGSEAEAAEFEEIMLELRKAREEPVISA